MIHEMLPFTVQIHPGESDFTLGPFRRADTFLAPTFRSKFKLMRMPIHTATQLQHSSRESMKPEKPGRSLPWRKGKKVTDLNFQILDLELVN